MNEEKLRELIAQWDKAIEQLELYKEWAFEQIDRMEEDRWNS